MEDFRRLIELLLPTFLRKERLLAFLNVLIGTPLEQLYSNYVIWQERTKYDASITPQVCSLRHAIEKNYDVQCNIIELDGKPYDYLVEIDRSTDYNSIHTFLLKYGTAGKSFLFNLGDTTIDVTWTDFIEQNEITTYEAEWSNYVEFDDGDTPIDIFFYYVPNIAERKLSYRIEVKSQSPMNDIEIIILTHNRASIQIFSSWIIHRLEPNGENEMLIEQDVSEEEFERLFFAVIGKKEGSITERQYYIDHIYYVKPEELKK